MFLAKTKRRHFVINSVIHIISSKLFPKLFTKAFYVDNKVRITITPKYTARYLYDVWVWLWQLLVTRSVGFDLNVFRSRTDIIRDFSVVYLLWLFTCMLINFYLCTMCIFELSNPNGKRRWGWCMYQDILCSTVKIITNLGNNIAATNVGNTIPNLTLTHTNACCVTDIYHPLSTLHRRAN